jgi:hypothetical protein
MALVLRRGTRPDTRAGTPQGGPRFTAKRLPVAARNRREMRAEPRWLGGSATIAACASISWTRSRRNCVISPGEEAQRLARASAVALEPASAEPLPSDGQVPELRHC